MLYFIYEILSVKELLLKKNRSSFFSINLLFLKSFHDKSLLY